MYLVLQSFTKKYLSGDEDLLQQPVVILLKGVQLPLSLGLGTQLSVLDHFRIEVAIWVEITSVIIRKCIKSPTSMIHLSVGV